MHYEQIDFQLSKCEYFFGVDKKTLDKLVLDRILESHNPDEFYKVRIELLSKNVDNLLETHGVTDFRVLRVVTARDKWKIRYEEE